MQAHAEEAGAEEAVMVDTTKDMIMALAAEEADSRRTAVGIGTTRPTTARQVDSRTGRTRKCR